MWQTRVDWLAYINCLLEGWIGTVTLDLFWKSLFTPFPVVFCGHIMDPGDCLCARCGFPVYHREEPKDDDS